jgi:hypothetical protein
MTFSFERHGHRDFFQSNQHELPNAKRHLRALESCRRLNIYIYIYILYIYIPVCLVGTSGRNVALSSQCPSRSVPFRWGWGA